MAHSNTYIVVTEYYLPDIGNIYTYNGDDEFRSAAMKHYTDEYTNISWGKTDEQDEQDDFNSFMSCHVWSTSIESIIKFMIVIGENVIIHQTGVGWKYVIVTNENGNATVYKN